MSSALSKGKQQAQAIADGGVMTHRQILFVIFGLMAGMFLSSSTRPSWAPRWHHRR
jgi:hypothetical protein